MKTVIICIGLLMLIGCTTEPLNLRYYLLHSPKGEIANVRDNSKSTIALQIVNVADYLRQSNLVMQINQHEMYYSQQDVWAEKLQTSFQKALLQDLNSLGKQNYVAASSPIAKVADIKISIELEHFHATDMSTAVGSGRYWISTNTNKNGINSVITSENLPFFFESDLQQDGFAHAVEQLRTVIFSLSNQINKDISALPNI